MKKYFSFLVLSAALFGAGCASKKRNVKAAHEQKVTVETNFIQEEQAADTKEDYSVIA